MTVCKRTRGRIGRLPAGHFIARHVVTHTVRSDKFRIDAYAYSTSNQTNFTSHRLAVLISDRALASLILPDPEQRRRCHVTRRVTLPPCSHMRASEPLPIRSIGQEVTGSAAAAYCTLLGARGRLLSWRAVRTPVVCFLQGRLRRASTSNISMPYTNFNNKTYSQTDKFHLVIMNLLLIWTTFKPKLST